ncbi:hypothetical protein B0H12DRAFT_1069548 [Mycena haematopus]|nr:hypothetical protein B0H12DRAFT_1069548 [Mycena haematopus]
MTPPPRTKLRPLVAVRVLNLRKPAPETVFTNQHGVDNDSKTAISPRTPFHIPFSAHSPPPKYGSNSKLAMKASINGDEPTTYALPHPTQRTLASTENMDRTRSRGNELESRVVRSRCWRGHHTNRSLRIPPHFEQRRSAYRNPALADAEIDGGGCGCGIDGSGGGRWSGVEWSGEVSPQRVVFRSTCFEEYRMEAMLELDPVHLHPSPSRHPFPNARMLDCTRTVSAVPTPSGSEKPAPHACGWFQSHPRTEIWRLSISKKSRPSMRRLPAIRSPCVSPPTIPRASGGGARWGDLKDSVWGAYRIWTRFVDLRVPRTRRHPPTPVWGICAHALLFARYRDWAWGLLPDPSLVHIEPANAVDTLIAHNTREHASRATCEQRPYYGRHGRTKIRVQKPRRFDGGGLGVDGGGVMEWRGRIFGLVFRSICLSEYPGATSPLSFPDGPHARAPNTCWTPRAPHNASTTTPPAPRHALAPTVLFELLCARLIDLCSVQAALTPLRI